MIYNKKKSKNTQGLPFQGGTDTSLQSLHILGLTSTVYCILDLGWYWDMQAALVSLGYWSCTICLHGSETPNLKTSLAMEGELPVTFPSNFQPWSSSNIPSNNPSIKLNLVQSNALFRARTSGRIHWVEPKMVCFPVKTVTRTSVPKLI